MKIVNWCIIIFLVVSMWGCSDASKQPSQQGQTKTESAYIENKGSDTIVNLALAWAERYSEVRPDVRISVTGGGSGTGLAALTNGTVDIANASRAIKAEEIAMLEEQGYTPVEFVIARDAIAVIVNSNNPIQKLTLGEVSKIYLGEINNWKELGGEDRPIVRLSRETNSGTHVYFLEQVIRLGNKEDTNIFSADTLLLPSSEGIIVEVRDNPNAIGYDGLGYVTPDVKVIAIAKNSQVAYIYPSVETVTDGTYPISRNLYMYTREEPSGEVKVYLDWILSSEAQDIVAELGFVPNVPAK
ncbi:MAG: phosphate ABC transporter substrate-binding protein [Anaerolineaceae bacterium]|nr:phosphate ABC transporter substrate-binding protein [Anaerolineaceae bacterium]